jgi:pyruvate formate lyase activating enzyme
MPDGAAGPAMATVAAVPRLRVGGFEPYTSTDYPDALAAVVFCQGCPWRCGYCHNPHLIAATSWNEHDFGRILEWLASRRGLLDAVVFSGGEPTAQRQLGAAIDAVRALGFAVGLHTGGAYPRRLAKVLSQIDWAGIDVKAAVADYATVTGVPDSGINALASLDLIQKAGIAYEVRTTVHPLLTPPDAIERLARELAARGVERWILQPFRAIGCANAALVAAAPKGATLDHALLMRLSRHVPVIEVRV